MSQDPKDVAERLQQYAATPESIIDAVLGANDLLGARQSAKPNAKALTRPHRVTRTITYAADSEERLQAQLAKSLPDGVFAFGSLEIAVSTTPDNEQPRWLTLRSWAPVVEDWYEIEWKDHDGREWWEPSETGGRVLHKSSRPIPKGALEGTGADMRAVAEAIEQDSVFYAKRVDVTAAEKVYTTIARPGYGSGVNVPRIVAQALAAEIRKKLP